MTNHSLYKKHKHILNSNKSSITQQVNTILSPQNNDILEDPKVLHYSEDNDANEYQEVLHDPEDNEYQEVLHDPANTEDNEYQLNTQDTQIPQDTQVTHESLDPSVITQDHSKKNRLFINGSSKIIRTFAFTISITITKRTSCYSHTSI